MSYESNALRAAAATIKTQGHAQRANARDERGRACAISKGHTFSLYGAVSRALNAGDVELQTGRQHADLWATLTNAAAERMSQLGLRGAANQHPVFALNDVPGFNATAAVEFLLEAAEKLEKVSETLRNGAAT